MMIRRPLRGALLVLVLLLGLAAPSAADTFGNTVAGASSEYTGLQTYCKFTSSGAGTITAITAFVSSAAVNNVRVAIFANTAGNPTTLLAQSAGATAIDADDIGAWETVAISYAFSATTTYWLALWFSDAGGNGRYYYDAGSANQQTFDTGTYPTWTSPATAIGVNARNCSLYATFTAAGGAASPRLLLLGTGP